MCIKVQDLKVSLKSGKHVIEGISFQVKAGEMVSIVGSSGTGKTTICKAIMGLLGNEYNVDGIIEYEGKLITSVNRKTLLPIYGNEICFIMQNPMTVFNPSIRIGRQLEKTYLLHHEKTSRKEIQKKCLDTFQQLGLTDGERILKNYPDALSGGMLQRVMIAAALINNPKILVADEATTAIDACNRIALMKLLKSFTRQGMSVLFITHDLRSARNSDRVLVMDKGRIIESGKTENVFGYPKEAYTRELLNACYLERRAQ